MLPPFLRDFLERATVAVAATRDARLVPRVRWASGWALEPDGETLLCLLSRGFEDGAIESLAGNGRMALTAEVIGPHDTYQYKGAYLDHRAAVPSDWALFGRCSERYVTSILEKFGPMFTRDQLQRQPREPVLALRFRVEEVFLQTPGPQAGMRVFPEA